MGDMRIACTVCSVLDAHHTDRCEIMEVLCFAMTVLYL